MVRALSAGSRQASEASKLKRLFPLVVVIAGVAAGLVAWTQFRDGDPEPGSRESEQAVVAAPETPAAPGESPASGREIDKAPPVAPKDNAGEDSAAEDEEAAPANAGKAPSFDIVRVNRAGEAVIAGRAQPESEVELTDGTEVIGRVRSDRRGEWVLIPDRPLEPGAREIGLVSRSERGGETKSGSVVVVNVPERGGSPSEGTGEAETPLAVLVPREGLGPSTVLQQPGSDPVASPPPAAEPSPSAASGHREGGTTRIASVGPSHDAASGALVERSSPATKGLSLETIDYDEAGRVALSGTASPGARVGVFLDDDRIGETRADAEGRWEMTPAEDVEPGRYTLRADQIDDGGKVAARIRLPFARVDAAEDHGPGALVVVQPGNSLWRIARRTYGRGARYTLIYNANQQQIEDPDLIYPGQVFSLPEMADEL